MLFIKRFKIGDEVIVTTRYKYLDGTTRIRKGKSFIITEIAEVYYPTVDGHTSGIARRCYSSSSMPWIPAKHLKRKVYLVFTSKNSTAVKHTYLSRFLSWILN